MGKTPRYIRRFFDNFEINKKLCHEIEYILSTEIAKKEIEIAQITFRAKTLESFCEKISRKSYSNPFDEITDFSGVRVVYLYSVNKLQIENIIEKEFEVVEKVDKALVDDNVFGYVMLCITSCRSKTLMLELDMMTLKTRCVKYKLELSCRMHGL